jgi:hypothetical protein
MRFPPTEYYYSAVGHSLGGAICDELLKAGLVRDAWSYNPAVSVGDFRTPLNNHRVYMDADPLYQLMGRNTINPEVRKYKPRSMLQRFMNSIPYAGKVAENLDAHSMANFQGGGKDAFMRQLADVGLSPEIYLKRARASAKREGYNPKGVSFANDGVHKLAYTDGKRTSKFGRVGYRDFIIWKFLGSSSNTPSKPSSATPQETTSYSHAIKKRATFRASHSQMKGDWKRDPLSPNNLALKILW